MRKKYFKITLQLTYLLLCISSNKLISSDDSENSWQALQNRVGKYSTNKTERKSPQKKRAIQNLSQNRLSELINKQKSSIFKNAHLFVLSSDPNSTRDNHYEHLYEATINKQRLIPSKYTYTLCTKAILLSFVKDEYNYFGRTIKHESLDSAIQKTANKLYFINGTPFFLILPQSTEPGKSLLDLSSCTRFPQNQLDKKNFKTLQANLSIWIENSWKTSAILKDERGNSIAPHILTQALRKIFSRQIDYQAPLKKTDVVKMENPTTFKKEWETTFQQKAAKNIGWNIFLQGHGSTPKYVSPQYKEPSGQIAGIPMSEFLRFLQFFNRINTLLMEVISCHAGGKNREYIVGKGIGQDSHYQSLFTPKGSQKVPDAYYMNLIPPILKYPLVLLSSTDAPTFSYTHSPSILMSRFESIPQYNNWIRTITDELLNDNFPLTRKINRLPLILYPYHNSFNLLTPVRLSEKEQSFQVKPHEFWSKLLLINNVLTKKHLIENKPIIIADKKLVVSNQLIHATPLIFTTMPLKITKKAKAQGATPNMTYRDWIINAKNTITKDTIEKNSLFELQDWNFNSATLFTVKSDLVKISSNNKYNQEGFLRPSYPTFFPLQTGNNTYYFKSISLQDDDVEKKQTTSGRRGVFLFLRNMFFNPNERETTHLYFIEELKGINDLHYDIINGKSALTSLSRQDITLNNIAIKTSSNYNFDNNSRTDFINVLFSCQKRHYNFTYSYNPEAKNTQIAWDKFIEINEQTRNNLLMQWEHITVDQRRIDESSLATSIPQAKGNQTKRYDFTYHRKKTGEFYWENLKEMTSKGKLIYAPHYPFILQASNLYNIYQRFKMGEQWERIDNILNAQSKKNLDIKKTLINLQEKLRTLKIKLGTLKQQLTMLRSKLV